MHVKLHLMLSQCFAKLARRDDVQLPVVASGLCVWSGVVGELCVGGGAEGGGDRGPTSSTV